jgi:hypothetical protein
MLRTDATVAIGSGFNTTTAALDVAARITANALPWAKLMTRFVMPPAGPDPEIPAAMTESHQTRSAVMAFLDPDNIACCLRAGDVVCLVDIGSCDYRSDFDNEFAVLAHPLSHESDTTPKTPLGILSRATPQRASDGQIYVTVIVQGIGVVNNRWLKPENAADLDASCPPGTRLRVIASLKHPAPQFLQAILVVYDEPACLVHLV